MKEEINKIFSLEKNFDQIVETLLDVVEKEKDPKKRKEKIFELTDAIKRDYLGAHHDAITDPLTGCFNKKRIKEIFKYQYATAKRNKQYFSLAVIDIDYLKHINDSYGHAMGDQVIKRIVKAIVAVIRENDLVFRYGGDEFIIFCTHNEAGGMRSIVDRINPEIAKIKLIKDFKPSVTIGYKINKPAVDDKLTYAGIFKEADNMLYEKKNKRKPPKVLNLSHQ